MIRETSDAGLRCMVG